MNIIAFDCACLFMWVTVSLQNKIFHLRTLSTKKQACGYSILFLLLTSKQYWKKMRHSNYCIPSWPLFWRGMASWVQSRTSPSSSVCAPSTSLFQLGISAERTNIFEVKQFLGTLIAFTVCADQEWLILVYIYELYVLTFLCNIFLESLNSLSIALWLLWYLDTKSSSLVSLFEWNLICFRSH